MWHAAFESPPGGTSPEYAKGRTLAELLDRLKYLNQDKQEEIKKSEGQITIVIWYLSEE